MMLAMKDLSFQNAGETVTAMEMATQEAKDLKKSVTIYAASSSLTQATVMEKQEIPQKSSKRFDDHSKCYICGGRYEVYECQFKVSELLRTNIKWH